MKLKIVPRCDHRHLPESWKNDKQLCRLEIGISYAETMLKSTL